MTVQRDLFRPLCGRQQPRQGLRFAAELDEVSDPS
jgi:hypothetical protein